MRWRDATFVAGLTVLILATYAPSFPGDFHFDDYPLMLDSAAVTGPSFSPGLFLENYGGRPLTLWTFHWNHVWFGQDSFGYHAVNIALHLIAVCLLFVFISREVTRGWAAFLAALFFGLHPIQTQAVDYIWSRSVLLMFCFGLGAVLLVRRFPWPSLVLLQLAIWSRTDAIVFILPMILMNRRFWKAPLALCLANVAAFAYSLWVFRPLQVGWTHPNAWSYWLSECVALWKYLGLVAWPAGLSVDHDVLRPGAWIAVVAIVGLGGLAAVLWRVRTSAPALAFGGAWFFVALAPAALIPNADILTESRVYPAVAGISVALAWAMAGRWRKPVAALVVAGLIVATPVTLARNRLWNRDVALWKDAAEKSPLKPRTHYNLGVAWAREGKVDQAEQAFRRAFALDPSDGWSAAALGYCAEFRQDLGRAETLYLQAVSLDSGNRYAQEGLDRVRKREDESESAYNLRGKSGVALSDPEFSRPVDGHAPGE